MLGGATPFLCSASNTAPRMYIYTYIYRMRGNAFPCGVFGQHLERDIFIADIC